MGSDRRRLRSKLQMRDSSGASVCDVLWSGGSLWALIKQLCFLFQGWLFSFWIWLRGPQRPLDPQTKEDTHSLEPSVPISLLHTHTLAGHYGLTAGFLWFIDSRLNGFTIFFNMFLSFLSFTVSGIAPPLCSLFFPFSLLHACKVLFLHCLPSRLLSPSLLFILVNAETFSAASSLFSFQFVSLPSAVDSRTERSVLWPAFLLQIGFGVKIIKSNRWFLLKWIQWITEATCQDITTTILQNLDKNSTFPFFKGWIT